MVCDESLPSRVGVEQVEMCLCQLKDRDFFFCLLSRVAFDEETFVAGVVLSLSVAFYE